MKEHLRYFSISLISLFIVTFISLIDEVHFQDPMYNLVYGAFCDTFTFALTFAMLASWGISVIRRVMQTSVRRYLILSDIAMIFWLFVREIKWRYVSSPRVVSWLWYLFYVPMILIPLYGFFASLYLGKDDSFKLSAKWHGAYLAAIVLIVLILTNNTHEMVFKFSDKYASNVGEYSYGWGYYVAVVWIVIFTALYIIIAGRRCNRETVGWKRYISFAFLALGLVYGYGYINQNSLKWFPDIDLMMAFDWFTIMIWETSIELGLVTVNSYYLEFFKRSSIGAVITDKEGNPYISAHNAINLPKEAFDNLLENGTYQYNLAIRLHIYPTTCGYAVWQEDVSTVNGMIETLKGIQDELKEGNTLAEQEMQAEVRKKQTEEATRIYTLLTKSMEDELAIINGLTREILQSSDLIKIKRYMANINFEGVYLKRKGNFIMIAETRNTIPWEELELALMEIEKNLTLCDMQFSYKLNIDREMDIKELIGAFEAIESVVSTKLFKINALFVRIDSFGQGLKMLVKQPDSKDLELVFERGDAIC